MQEHIRTLLRYSHSEGLRRVVTKALTSRHIALPVGLMAAAILVLAGLISLPLVSTASNVDVLGNGSFEQGFKSIPGCGIVGAHWNCFTNGGAAAYGFYDDQWDLVVADGKHSQLIEINTKGLAAADADRYAGIYQTVRVQPWEHYKLSLRGIIRSTNQDGDPWRYRVQVGWTKGAQTDWRHVNNWTDVGWNTYYKRTEPGAFSSFQTILMPGDAEAITVFVRVWKKWGVPNHELDVNLDSISLVGPAPGKPEPVPHMPEMQPDKPASMGMGGPIADPYRPDKEPEMMYPAPTQGLSCGGTDLLFNGSFEHGFNRIWVGDVGRGWAAFTNGGAANYGFYDEQWQEVIADGKHGQLIEINTKGIVTADADRYAGIYQRVSGLKPGATYELTLRGLLRGEGNEDDPYRFAAQWGLNEGGDTEWRNVRHWKTMDLGEITPRTEPRSMGSYTARFQAPSSDVVIFIRGWKKWGVSEVEFDLNLDAISLEPCGMGGTGGPMKGTMPEMENTECVYIVSAGDTLAAIAGWYRVSTEDLIRANDIANPDLIYVGQKFQIPGCRGMADEPGPKPSMERPGEEGPKSRMPESQDGMRTHRVVAGDSLGMLAEQYGTDVVAIARANGVNDMNVIYVGQILVIP